MCKCDDVKICQWQLQKPCTFKELFSIGILVNGQNELPNPFFWEGKSKGKPQLKKMVVKKSGLRFLFLMFSKEMNKNGISDDRNFLC